jgi:type I restriction enzyme S subunit
MNVITSAVWETVRLEDLADNITVGHVGSMANEYKEGGIPFLRSLNVEPYRINNSDLKFIDPVFHRKLKKSALRPGDVVIVRTGRPGTCAVIPDSLPEANCSDLVIVRCGKKLDNRFLAYFINSLAVQHIAAHCVGAVQQHFNVGSARKIQINLPPVAEQRKITDTLGSLDDRITLLRETNTTLEAIAQALFKSWFVDFDPVRAKAEGREPEGVPPEVVDLFPDELVGSELGMIPKGWSCQPFSTICDAVGGSTPSTKEDAYWKGGIHCWVTPKDLSGVEFPVLLDTERRITDLGLEKISSGLLPAGTVLMSSRAPIGYLAIAEVPVAVNQGFIAMKPKDGVTNLFLLQTVKTRMDEIKSRANGSTFMEISKAAFRPIPALVPSESLVAAYDTLARPLYKRLVANVRQSNTLVELRDTLLPRLMSGKLRIADVEKELEAV